MNNNDIIRRLKYALNTTDLEIAKLFGLVGMEITEEQVKSFVVKEGDPEYKVAGDKILNGMLDGLIIAKRGRRDGDVGAPEISSRPMTNNMILKKLRIAFSLKEDDMLEIFKLSGFVMSRSEVSALCRREGQHNYREMGDQGLRNFLAGLTKKLGG